ncbi:MAG: MBL fold metallo-hydrolase [Actinobacteria bacterium]|nr:MBL fold metallo-hydrolase [Actinomycetota bacterium]
MRAGMANGRVFEFNQARIEFFGGAGEVTGSKALLQAHGRSVLIDCGLFQGEKTSRQMNWAAIPEALTRIDAILITHAHLDHCGYLPRLVKAGYRGPVYCSPGTRDLMKIILLDSAHLQEEDAEFANRTGYSHHKPAEPLYTVRDAEAALSLVKTLPMGLWQTLLPGIEVELTRAGHIIGSSVARFRIKSGGGDFRITFSGDLGHTRQHTILGPDPLPDTDVLVLESTYGDRAHSSDVPEDELEKTLSRIIRNNSVLVIPTFAVGRAQEVLYLIRHLEDQGRVKPVPVVLDQANVEVLWAAIEADARTEITVDIERLVIEVPSHGLTYPFVLDASTRERFLHGLDDIGITLTHESAIDDYETRRPAWL